MFGMGTSSDIPTNRMDIQISETKGTNLADFCNINLVTAGEFPWRESVMP